MQWLLPMSPSSSHPCGARGLSRQNDHELSTSSFGALHLDTAIVRKDDFLNQR
jgi:hypothetical protein